MESSASSRWLTIAWQRRTNEYLAGAPAYSIYNGAAMTSYLGTVAGPSPQKDVYSLIIHPISNIRSTWNGSIVSWCLQPVPWHVIAIANCQTYFVWIAWPVPPRRTWEGYIYTDLRASGRKRVHISWLKQSVMLHGTLFTTSDALILPGGSHWYKFDNKPAYFHDCPLCRFARN